MSEAVSYGRRITQLAAADPDRPSLTVAGVDRAEVSLTRRELDLQSNRAARLLEKLGAGQGSMVVIDLQNSLEHMIAAIGGWKLGCVVLPIRSSLPGAEREDLLELAAPAALVTAKTHDRWPSTDLRGLDEYSDAALPDRVADPGKSIASGGSTGRPKIIVRPGPWAFVPGALARSTHASVGFQTGYTQLVGGPLYHNTPFSWSVFGLFEEQHVILMQKFDAEHWVELVGRHKVQFAPMVPTMMRRILRLPDLEPSDLASLKAIFHTAAPCPPWVKRGWIDLIGAENVYEGFGSTEDVGWIGNRGDEWLTHPGTLGRPQNTELRILDEDGNQVPPGEVGEIFLKAQASDAAAGYRYIGSAPAKSTPDGYTSVGDLGWVDEDGFVYLADRRVDLIITGGANVYPAEVEAALTEHPAVADVAVIPVPDEEWGRRVHAVVQRASDVTSGELNEHCRERLASYKVPKTYEFIDVLPRDEAGKIRRSALAAERAGTPAAKR